MVAIVVRLIRCDRRAETEWRRRAGPAGIFPLRLARQAQIEAGHERGDPPEELAAIIPVDAFHWTVGALEPARVCSHHRLPQGLGAGSVEQPEPSADRDPMLRTFIVVSLRLGRGRTPQK